MVEHFGNILKHSSLRFKTPLHESPQIHYYDHFENKVNTIGESTKNAPMPDWVLRTAVRLINDLSPMHQITFTLTQLHWLSIRTRIVFKIFLIMYHIHSGTSPLCMLSMVTPSSASRSRGLRSSTRGDFAVISTNMKFDNRAFQVSGPREWNSIPASVRQCTSVAQFKPKLKPVHYHCTMTKNVAERALVQDLFLLKRDINAQYYCIVLYIIATIS